jgi:hypothetical protein
MVSTGRHLVCYGKKSSGKQPRDNSTLLQYSGIKILFFFARTWCLMPAILATQETEIRRIVV